MAYPPLLLLDNFHQQFSGSTKLLDNRCDDCHGIVFVVRVDIVPFAYAFAEVCIYIPSRVPSSSTPYLSFPFFSQYRRRLAHASFIILLHTPCHILWLAFFFRFPCQQRSDQEGCTQKPSFGSSHRTRFHFLSSAGHGGTFCNRSTSS